MNTHLLSHMSYSRCLGSLSWTLIRVSHGRSQGGPLTEGWVPGYPD